MLFKGLNGMKGDSKKGSAIKSEIPQLARYKYTRAIK